MLLFVQATLGGKMKGKSIQYHSNISKDEGRIFYDKFVSLSEVFSFSDLSDLFSLTLLNNLSEPLPKNFSTKI